MRLLDGSSEGYGYDDVVRMAQTMALLKVRYVLFDAHSHHISFNLRLKLCTQLPGLDRCAWLQTSNAMKLSLSLSVCQMRV